MTDKPTIPANDIHVSGDSLDRFIDVADGGKIIADSVKIDLPDEQHEIKITATDGSVEVKPVGYDEGGHS